MADDDTPAAVSLQASLAEFSTPDTAAAAPADDFLAQFDEVLSPSAEAKPAEPAVTETTEPEPAPAATEDPDTDPYPEEIPNASDKAKAKWGEIKSDLKKTRAELREERDRAAAEIKKREDILAERERELEEARQKLVSLPELTERAKLADDAERELAVARVEGTREYKQTITEPLDAIGTSIEAIAKANEINPDTIFDAIVERDPAKRREMLKEVVTSLDEVDRLEIAQMAKDAQSILLKRDQIRANAVEARKELEEISTKQAQEMSAKVKKEFLSNVDHAVGELKKRIPFLALVDGETADAVFNAIAEKAKEADFDAAPAGTKAYSAAAGVLLPRVAKQLSAALEKVKTLEARVAERNATTPTVGGNEPAAPSNGDEDLLDVTAKLFGLPRAHNVLESLNTNLG